MAIRAILLLLFPVVLFGGGAVMSATSGRSLVTAAFQQYRKEHPQEAEPVLRPEDEKFLNLRMRGYNVRDVAAHWIALRTDARAREAEQLFLRLDLIFPFVYGGALAMSLLAAWSAVRPPFALAWLLLLIVVGVVADWTENLVQLAQLERYASSGVAGLDGAWIRAASIATMTKMIALGLAYIAVVALVAVMHRVMTR